MVLRGVPGNAHVIACWSVQALLAFEDTPRGEVREGGVRDGTSSALRLVWVLFFGKCLLHLVECIVNLPFVVHFLALLPLLLLTLAFLHLVHLLHQFHLIGLLVLLAFVELSLGDVFEHI